MITFNEAFAALPATGWLTRPEAELLWTMMSATEGPILEVGCYHGRSTCLLAATGRQVICVDPFIGFDSDDPSGESTLDAFLANTARFPNVQLQRFRIEDWEPPSSPIRLCYLDGDHTYEGTLSQIRKALACDPGVVAVHDVNDDGGGAEVKRACLELLGPWDERDGRLAVWHKRFDVEGRTGTTPE